MKFIAALLTALLLSPPLLVAQMGPSFGIIASAQPATYYIGPGGNDTNLGTSSGSPWLTPAGHTLNCGDTLVALAGSYSSANFGSGHWSPVSCPAGNNVAWLKCITFDGCKISGGNGILIDKSYWGVQGWEVSAPTSVYPCFGASPSGSTNIHHILFANNVANGCGGGGIATFNNSTHSVDYIGIVGNIVYSAAQSAVHCFSGISVYQPIAVDNVAGTHIYIGGNFSYGNHSPSNCEISSNPSGAATASDGGILDTLDGSQGLSGTWGTPLEYLQQVVMAFNIFVGNGGRGIEYQTYTKGAAATSWPTVYRYNNTVWGNSTDTAFSTALCNEMDVNVGYGVNDFNNIAQSIVSTACGGHVSYAYSAWDESSSKGDTSTNNWFYSASGLPTSNYNDDSQTFTFGSNFTSTSPGFSSPFVPGAPACSGKASTADCMNNLILGFVPSATGTSGLGYQAPTYFVGADPYFPVWFCTANVPLGLVTVKC